VLFLARKNLFEQPLRLSFSILGVGLAVMLILVMWAILEGILGQAGAYVKNTNAQVWVVQKGFTDIAHGFSIVRSSSEERLEEIPGVRSANPITGARSEVPTPEGGETAVSVVGYDTDSGVGGPWDFASDPVVPGSGEVVVDETFADTAGLEVGDPLELPDRPREIVALSAGTNQFQNQLAFGELDDVRGLLRLGRDDVNFFALQVEPNRVAGVQRAIRERFPAVTPFAKATFVENNEAEIRESFEPILWVMVAIAFFVGSAIVGLTMYTATTEKAREYGVLSAIGADRAALRGVVLRQAAVASTLGFLLGCLLTIPAAGVVKQFAPNTELEFPIWLFGLTAAAAVVMALLASYVPVRRLASLDPSAVFRA
jgi:putative ABC transport system permease protein